MINKHLLHRSHTIHLTMILMLAWSISTGCGDPKEDDTVDPVVECGGNGDFHEDHCDCNAGFEPTEDGKSCVPEQKMEDPKEDPKEDPMDEFMFAPTTVRAATGPGENGKQVWLLEAAYSGSLMSVEIYEAFGGPSSPGTVQMTQKETNYKTCGTCIVLRTDCTLSLGDVKCNKTFMPRAQGEVQFDAMGKMAGQQIKGTMKNLSFQEVTIAEDYETSPVTDGQILSIKSWTFNALLESLGGEQKECDGHGHLHGNTCHCDPGYRLDPEDPKNCIQ